MPFSYKGAYCIFKVQSWFKDSCAFMIRKACQSGIKSVLCD